MSLDRPPGLAVARASVAALAGLVAAGCGPAVRPDAPDPAESAGVAPARRAVGPAARSVVVGELCPAADGGRPAIDPLLLRGVGWSDRADDADEATARSVRRFAVFGPSGARAGVFEVLGLGDVGLGGEVAIGSYLGRPPCAPASVEGGAPPDPACVAATGGCGLAVGLVDDRGPAEPDTARPAVGVACRAGDALLVDVDGDGAAEAFPLAAFVDPVRAPAAEVSAAPVVGAACDPAEPTLGITVRPPADAGQPDDPRYHVVLDLLGVLDLDGEGRHELVLAFRYPEGRTIAVYAAPQLPGRMELVGEAAPWQ